MPLSIRDVRDSVVESCDVLIPDTADANQEDHVALTYILKVIADMQKSLAHAYQYVEDRLVAAAPEKEFLIEGIGNITIRTGVKRQKWDHEALWTDVTRALLESVDGPDEFVRGLRDAVTASWKVTGLRPLGIDPDEYCEVAWGRKTVQFPKEALSVPAGAASNGQGAASQESVGA